jgi:ADP-ribosylglycohydrolase
MNKPSVAQYRGCMFGLAIGDALGAPIEFMALQEIKEQYGAEGLTKPNRPLQYTDDTQMSLATALGLLGSYARAHEKDMTGASYMVYLRYLDWLRSQDDPAQQKAPGNTCLSALRSGVCGTIQKPINNSKGCGGVMRVAPAGLAFARWGEGQAFEYGAQFAAITHGHPSGYLTAGLLAQVIAHIINGSSLDESLDQGIGRLIGYDGHEETLAKVEQARSLAASDRDVEKAIADLGEGWIAEEALAIAIYCALRFPDDWRAGVLAAVNHSGDSDSTGSICGAILGASLGLNAIPPEWARDVENGPEIMKIADDMYLAFQQNEEMAWEDYPGP